jgi:hypothetical protein
MPVSPSIYASHIWRASRYYGITILFEKPMASAIFFTAIKGG